MITHPSMKYDDLGFPYVESPADLSPEYMAGTCRSYFEFFTLREGVRTFKPDNIEELEGLFYLLKESEDVYRPRRLGYHTDRTQLEQQILNGRITLLFSQEQRERTKTMLARLKMKYYDQFIPLMEIHHRLWHYKVWNKKDEDYLTQIALMEKEIKRLSLY